MLKLGTLYERKEREAFIKDIDDGHMNHMIKIEPEDR